MAILTTVGRTAWAAAIKALPLHLAWGTGDAAWDTIPVAPLLGDTALVAEVGRVAVTTTGYAEVDAEGEVETPSGNYTLVAGPTNNLYLRFDFGFAAASDQVIREVGLFIGTTIVPGLPAGQTYFLPAELATTGTLVAVERFALPLVRSPLTRQQFEFVLVI